MFVNQKGSFVFKKYYVFSHKDSPHQILSVAISKIVTIAGCEFQLNNIANKTDKSLNYYRIFYQK